MWKYFFFEIYIVHDHQQNTAWDPKERLYVNFERSYGSLKISEICNILVSAQKLSLNEWISLKFIQYMTINKRHVELEKKRGYASILAGVMAPDRSQNFQLSGFCSVTYVLLNNLCLNWFFSSKFIWYIIINRIQVEFENGG